MLEKVKGSFVQKGYRKRRSSFYKVEGGFYKLVHFQKGAYGDYFFIKVGLHPVGLPFLQANTLLIPDHPKEYECVLRERVGEIVEGKEHEIFSMPWIGDDMFPHIIGALVDIEAWFQKWGSFQTILDSSFDEISKMFPVAPICWEKQYQLLRFYCAVQTGDMERAQKIFSQYSDVTVQTVNTAQIMNFEDLDHYLRSMLET